LTGVPPPFPLRSLPPASGGIKGGVLRLLLAVVLSLFLLFPSAFASEGSAPSAHFFTTNGAHEPAKAEADKAQRDERDMQKLFDEFSRIPNAKVRHMPQVGGGTTGAAFILLGIALIVAEAFLPTFGIVGLGGVAALVTGAAIMFEAGSMPGWFNWGVIWGIAFAGLAAVGLTAYLTAKVYKQKISTGPESMVGGTAQIVEWSGVKGRVRVQGEIWSAFSDETYDLKKDDEVLVSKVEGLEIKIRTVE